MKKGRPKYLSYLLRLWRENDDGEVHHGDEQAVWRASLMNSLTGKRQGFSSLQDLFAFLQQATSAAVDGAKKECDV